MTIATAAATSIAFAELADDLELDELAVARIEASLQLVDELEAAHAPHGLDELTIRRYIRLLREPVAGGHPRRRARGRT